MRRLEANNCDFIGVTIRHPETYIHEAQAIAVRHGSTVYGYPIFHLLIQFGKEVHRVSVTCYSFRVVEDLQRALAEYFHIPAGEWEGVE